MLGVRLLMKGLGVRMKSLVMKMMKILNQLVNGEKGNIVDYGNKKSTLSSPNACRRIVLANRRK
jgi:hypothetical protein